MAVARADDEAVGGSCERDTESRRAREISLASGEAFTISRPSAPAAISESSRVRWLRSYSGSDSTLSAP